MSVSLTPVKLVQSNISNNQDEQICFPSHLMKRLGIENNRSLKIGFGKKFIQLKIHTLEIDKDEIHLSETTMNELFISGTTINKFLVKFIPANQTLYFGPVVALLTDFRPIQSESPHFRSIHFFCEELNQRVAEMGGLFYVFSCPDFSDKGVSGYYFENGNWIYSKLPFPDVIYNRVHSRKLEHIPLFTSFREILEQLNIPIFNDRFLSKWEVYQHLILEDQIHPYIPETRLLSQETFDEFINKYHSVYLKPVHGSQGKNIIKLVKEGEHIICQTSQSSDLTKYKSSEIFRQLKPLLHNRIYIIQQGIPLLAHQERTMDFRVLVHKNKHHLWKVTSLVARISAEQQFVSNLAKGGKVMKPINALNNCFNGEKSSQLVYAMKELSIKTASAISSHTKGITGELGIDIGVDQSGNPWIIEVNSKPSKSFEDNMVKIRPSAKAIIEFCTKLAFDGDLELEEKT